MRLTFNRFHWIRSADQRGKNGHADDDSAESESSDEDGEIKEMEPGSEELDDMLTPRSSSKYF